MSKRRTAAAVFAAAFFAYLAPPTHAGLLLESRAAPDPAAPGEAIELFITVSNDGVSSLTGVSVSMVVPANVDTFLESLAAADTSSCNTTGSTITCDPGETLTWTIGTLDPGEGETLYVPPVVAAGTLAGTIISFAPSAQDDQLAIANATATVEVQDAPAFALAIDESRNPVPSGDELVYTLKYGHVATARFAPDTTLSLNLPAGTVFVSASDGGSHSAGVVTWALGTLDPSQSGQVSATVTTGAGLADGEQLVAAATIADTDGETTRAGAITRVRDNAPLLLEMNVNPDPVQPGRVQDVRITVSNPGLFDRTDVRITALVPARVDTFLESLGQPATASCNVLGSTITCESRERLFWDIATLPAGEGIVVAMPPTVSAATPLADIVSYRAWVQDSAGAEAVAGESVETQEAPSFELALDTNRSPLPAGAELTYDLTYGHVSTTSIATGTSLVLPLPDGTTFAGASNGGVFAGGAVTWSLGTLGISEGGRVSATVTLDPGLPDGSLLRAEAVISDDGSPPQVSRASTMTRVLDEAPLLLAVEVNPDPVRPGQTHDVRLTATNAGAFDATNVRITVFIPEENAVFGESQAEPATGSCNVLGSTITCESRERLFWTIGDLAAGQGVTVAMPPRIADPTPDAGLVTYHAWLSDNSTGSSVVAVASASALVRSEPAFELALDDSSDPAGPGDALTYALTYGHVATDRFATGTTLRLDVPDGTTFVSASDGGALNGETIEWPLGTLAPSDGGQVRATLALDNGLVAGTVIEARAAIGDTETPAETAQAHAVTRVATDTRLTFSIEVNPDPVEPGQKQDVRLVVGNPGLFTRTGVTLSGILPDEIDVFGESLGGVDSASCNTLGSTVTCEARERFRYTVGSLEAGGSATYALPPVVTAGTPDADVISYRAWAIEDGGTQVDSYQSVIVAAEPAFDLALSVHKAPANTQADTTYSLTLGQRQVAADDASLTMRLPDNTSFVSASDGGLLNGDAVEWTVSGLEQGEGVTRSVTVAVDAASQGRLLETRAEVSKASLAPAVTRAFDVTPSAQDSPLALSMDVTPNPAVPRDMLDIDLTVENTTGLPIADVLLTVQVPEYLDTFAENLVSADAASCNNLGSTITCQSKEWLFWSIGTVAAGQSVTVDLPPIVSATGAPANGTVIRAHGFASGPNVDRIAITSDLLISDNDGIGDPFDNCLWAANPGQSDTDADNIGNACDADINQPNDCFVNFLDLNELSDAFFTNPASPNWNPDADFTGDNFVNFLDLAVMSDLFFLVPGPSGTGSACN